MENGKTTIALHDSLDIFDEEFENYDDTEEDYENLEHANNGWPTGIESEDSDVRVYKVLVESNQGLESAVFSSPEKTNDELRSVHTPSLRKSLYSGQSSRHSLIVNQSGDEESLLKRKSDKMVRFPANPGSSPKHYPNDADILVEEYTDNFDDDGGEANHRLREYCKGNVGLEC